MATRGRKPTPTHLKLVKGNPGKRPINEREPVPTSELPSVPEHLDDLAKVEWGRVSEELYRMGILSGVDRAALAVYCQAYARWERAERAIAKIAERDAGTGGLMIRTTNGNMVQNPLVGTANKAMSDMVRYAAEFGMTPSARSRIQKDEAHQAHADPAAEFFA